MREQTLQAADIDSTFNVCYNVVVFVCFIFCIYLPLEQLRASMSVCLSFNLSVSIVILCVVFCNFLFAIFCTYLGDQLSEINK